MEEEIKITYKNYCSIPDEGKRYDVIDGELYNAPAPFINHQRISRNLEIILYEWMRKNKLGEILDAPCDVVLSDIDVVQLDIIYVSNAKKEIITEKNIQGASDLVVEIISA